ncbi:MAG: preprotein translocase subunit YajC [Anaerovoracaceae bacterium]
MGKYGSIVLLILMILVMYLLLIRPQRKREKETNAMRNQLQVGDEIVTIGGICGRIVKTKEESLILQVGADKVKFEVMRWSVSKVTKPAGEKASKSESGRSTSADSAAETEAEKPVKKAPRRMKKPEAEEPAEDAAEEGGDVEEAAEGKE